MPGRRECRLGVTRYFRQSLISDVCIVIALLGAASGGAVAAPNEIKVFTDELSESGEHALETHINKASRSGSRAENHETPFQVMVEYSYGLWRHWEASLQLPVATQQRGAYLRIPRGASVHCAHDESQGAYSGFDIELGNMARNGEARFWHFEIIPIVGLRTGRWHLGANPGIHVPFSGSAKRAGFEPSAKISYRTFEKNHFGAEYYLDAGPLRKFLPGARQSRMLYLTWDGKIGRSDINIGIGRGTTDASDRHVVKIIYEIAF